ncbi:NmrA family NAD(P)-binding protein [Dyadobacter fermentans]|uniref:NmrA family protein n=1 Tax=Dyadobacter fermentans (strain ATCC 700827 / DSM 18053 / CIP 107007 / KCTC 52180 / NS114) TaxID=471854 RepID=C6W3D2_DYAFD|nr:NmrA family NAD(P)-binding protein [Dyadobacter fermentans]ACT92236.1 NmrA family protein [Dyadobacter fermentans DSM 18053]
MANIILGASGRVGSAVVARLVEKQAPVKGIVRNAEKAEALQATGADAAIADAHNLPALKVALRDGEALFALTPETGQEENVLGDTNDVLTNYRAALAAANIRKLVGLSSMGAQHREGTGNLVMSYMLEHAFDGLDLTRVFIRPAYYFSNWLGYLESAGETGVLPTFFPTDLKIPMICPSDVGHFAADVLLNDDRDRTIYEVSGPASYSSDDVAEAFEEVLGKKVKAQQIPRDQWAGTLQSIGFSKDGIRNFIEMTDAVISGKAGPQGNGTITAEMGTTLEAYLEQALKSA